MPRCALQQIWRTMSQLGHLRPTRSKRHVPVCPLRPESDLHKSRCDPPLRAKSGREQSQQSSALFDHLVCAREQRCWHVEAECLRGLEIDDHFDLGRKLDRQVAGFRAALTRSAYSFFGSDACNAALAFSSVSSPCIVRRSVSSTEVSSKFRN